MKHSRPKSRTVLKRCSRIVDSENCVLKVTHSSTGSTFVYKSESDAARSLAKLCDFPSVSQQCISAALLRGEGAQSKGYVFKWIRKDDYTGALALLHFLERNV